MWEGLCVTHSSSIDHKLFFTHYPPTHLYTHTNTQSTESTMQSCCNNQHLLLQMTPKEVAHNAKINMCLSDKLVIVRTTCQT